VANVPSGPNLDTTPHYANLNFFNLSHIRQRSFLSK
jgi:hypothetical protein